MATLTTGQSLDDVAWILSAARALSSRVWNPPHEAGTTMPTLSDFAGDIRDFFNLLAARRIPYVLVGGVALLKYIEGRNTEDIDVLLSVASLEAMPEIEIADRNRDFARGRFRQLQVDVLLTRNPVFSLVQTSHVVMQRFDDVEIPCATVEGLLLLKLYALPDLYEQAKFQRAILYENDIAMLAQRYRPDLSRMLQTLQPFVDAGLYAELERIVGEIETKVRRMQ